MKQRKMHSTGHVIAYEVRLYCFLEITGSVLRTFSTVLFQNLGFTPEATYMDAPMELLMLRIAYADGIGLNI